MKRPEEKMIAAHADNVSAAMGAELSNQANELALWIRELESRHDDELLEDLARASRVRRWLRKAESVLNAPDSAGTQDPGGRN